jgi:hypothetical protein
MLAIYLLNLYIYCKINKLYNINKLLSVWTYYNIAKKWSWNSEVALDNRGFGVRVPVGTTFFSSPCHPD